MKVLKRQLAIWVVVSMVMSLLCCNVNAMAVSSVTTGSGAALAADETTSISSFEDTINVSYTLDEGETAFSEDVSLAKDVTKETVMKVTNPGYYYKTDAIYYTPESDVSTGKYIVSFTFRADSASKGFGVRLDRSGHASFPAGLFYGLASQSKFYSASNASGGTIGTAVAYSNEKWYNVSVTFDLDATENADCGTYTATVTDLEAGTTQTGSYKMYNSGTVTAIKFGATANYTAGSAVLLKDIKVEYQATGSTEKVTKAEVNFTESDTLTDTAAVNVISCDTDSTGNPTSSAAGVDPVFTTTEIIASKTDVAYTGADDVTNKVYTLSDIDFEAGEDYTLFVGDEEYAFTVSDPYEAVITTGSGETVTDSGEIDLSETSLNLSYSTTVSESDLTEKVKLATDVQTGNILHIAKPGRAWDADNLRYTFNGTTGVTSGIYNVKYTYRAECSKHFGISLRGVSNGDKWRLGIVANNGAYTFGYAASSSNMNVSSGISYTPGSWYTVDVTFNFNDGKASVKITDADGNESTIAEHNLITTADAAGYIGFGPSSGTHASAEGDFVELKSFRVDYKENATAASVNKCDLDFLTDTLGEGLTCTVDASSDTVVTYPEVVTMNEISCTTAFDAENNVYTLTPVNGFELGKTYTIISGGNMVNFTVANLNGNLMVESVSKNSTAIENGDYVALGNNAIDIKFSGAMTKDTLDENVTLTHYAMKKMYHVEEPIRAFNKNGGLRYHFAENTGVYSIEHTFRTESITDYYGFSLRDGKNNPDTGTGDGVEIGRFSFKSAFNLQATDGTRGESGGMVGSFTREANKWTKMRIDVDMANRAFRVVVNDKEYFPSTTEWYVCKTTDFNLGYVCIGVMGDSTNATDICDMSVSYKASESAATTTLFKTDFSNTTIAQLGEVFKFGGADNPVIENRVDSESAVECIREYDAETNTYSLSPIIAANYMDEYELTIPEMTSADGKQLINPQSIRFTAVYLDSFLSGSAGFKAGATDITSISSSFTGTITGWAKVSNYSDSPATAKVIVALYKDGRLEDVNMGNISLAAGATDQMGSADVTVTTAGTGYTVVVYVWDDVDTMHAISPQSDI